MSATNRNATADTDEDFQGFGQAELTKIQQSQEQMAQHIKNLEKRVADLEMKGNPTLKAPDVENSPAESSESQSQPPLPEAPNQNKTDVPVSPASPATQPVSQASPASTPPPSPQQKQRLIKGIMALSEATELTQALKEWVYTSCNKSESNPDACLCGSKQHKYMFHIKKVETGRVVQLGASCINYIPEPVNPEDHNLGSVLRTAKSLFLNSGGSLLVTCMLNDPKKKYQLKLKLNRQASILNVKQHGALTEMYPGGIPLEEKQFLIAKAECNEAKEMKTDIKYRIWVKLYVDDNTAKLTLIADIIKAKLLQI